MNPIYSLIRYFVVLLFIAVPVASLSSGSAMAESKTDRFNANGESAYLEFASFSDGLIGSIFASRGGQGSQIETFIQYVQFNGVTGAPIQVGDGIIPNSAFNTTSKEYRLTVDTSSIPGFRLYAGTGGLVDVMWTQSSDWSTENTGHSKVEFNNVVARWYGSETMFSAKVTGSFIGTPFSNYSVGEGRLGKSSNKSFEVEHIQ